MNYILGENGEGGPSPEVYLDKRAAEEMDTITATMRIAAVADLGEGATEKEIEARTAELMSTKPMINKFLEIIVGAAQRGAEDRPLAPNMGQGIETALQQDPASA